jgi:hypothetical protein
LLAFDSALQLKTFMLKLLNLGLLFLSSAAALAQGAPTLDVFTNPDGAFHFSYPENYELLYGERILKATQGRHPGFPVCDFSKSLVCVIYPVERLGNDKVEAAGFSVDVVPLVTADRTAWLMLIASLEAIAMTNILNHRPLASKVEHSSTFPPGGRWTATRRRWTCTERFKKTAATNCTLRFRSQMSQLHNRGLPPNHRRGQWQTVRVNRSG